MALGSAFLLSVERWVKELAQLNMNADPLGKKPNRIHLNLYASLPVVAPSLGFALTKWPNTNPDLDPDPKPKKYLLLFL